MERTSTQLDVNVTIHWTSGRTTRIRRRPEFAAYLAHCLLIDQYPDINRIESS